jgi:hypothetical protein
MQSVTVFDLLEEEHACPHCQTRLTLCHAPPIHVGDGLGWGSEYLFICLNNECSLFANGWQNIENNYGHVGSYRHMKLPDSNECYNMMVAGQDAFTGSIVEPEEIRKSDSRYQGEKKALAMMDTCVAEKNIQPLLHLLLDDHVALHHRQKAVEMLIAINDPACIEPLRNHDYRNSHLEQTVNMAITQIMAANFVKECPYCAELVKVRANMCKHCGKELG